MAKAKTTGSQKDKAEKHVHDYHCSGGCGYERDICPECEDWGELNSRKSDDKQKASDQDTP